MTWEALGAVAETLGAVGVIITLIYLAIQVRHSKSAVEANTRSLEENRKLAIAQAYQQRVDHAAANVNSWRESDHLALYAGLKEPKNDEDRVRLRMYLRLMMNFCDNLEMQHKLGYMPDEIYRNQMDEMVRQFAPRWRANEIRELRSSFRAEVDSILQQEHGAGEESTK